MPAKPPPERQRRRQQPTFDWAGLLFVSVASIGWCSLFAYIIWG